MTILNESQVTDLGGQPLAIIAFFVLGFITLFFLALAATMLTEGQVDSFLVALAFTGVAAFFTYLTVEPAFETHKEYKVTIEDFNEVYDQGYVIIDQEGEIYTVIKKEDVQ